MWNSLENYESAPLFQRFNANVININIAIVKK